MCRPRGGTAYLSARHIAVVADDLGRLAITRSDARQLFDERRELEARAAEQRARLEQQAIEQDRQFRAQLNRGVPWYETPGLTPVQALLQPEYANRPRSVHQTLLDDALAGGGSTMVYHELPRGDEE